VSEDELVRDTGSSIKGRIGRRIKLTDSRFEFTMIIPSSLAPHNWVGGDGITASVTHQLHAELEGIPEESRSHHDSGSTTPTGPTSFFGKGKSKSKSYSPFTSGRKTPRTTSSHPMSRSPSPDRRGGEPDSQSLEAALLAATASMRVTEPARAPSYDESQAQAGQGSLTPSSPAIEDSEWLVGIHSTKRLVEVIYNPHPAGAVSQLDERISSSAPGLGEYHLRMAAEEVRLLASGVS
jgi:hypothetical protein